MCILCAVVCVRVFVQDSPGVLLHEHDDDELYALISIDNPLRSSSTSSRSLCFPSKSLRTPPPSKIDASHRHRSLQRLACPCRDRHATTSQLRRASSIDQRAPRVCPRLRAWSARSSSQPLFLPQALQKQNRPGHNINMLAHQETTASTCLAPLLPATAPSQPTRRVLPARCKS